MDRWLAELIASVRQGHAPDLVGSRVAAELAVSERLVNEVLAEKLGPDAAVRTVAVNVRPGEAHVSIKLARPAFLPAIPVLVTVERQPDLPTDAMLVLRMAMPAGLSTLAGAGVGLLNVLPPGVRLEGTRLIIDIATALDSRGYGWLLPCLRALNLRFEQGRIIAFVESEPPR